MANTQKAVLGFGLVLLMVLGVGTAFASGITNKSPLHYSSSVTIHGSTLDGMHEISEAQELAQLTRLAKITEGQARASAIKLVGEAINKVELENENGNIVYSIEVVKNNMKRDVKVDAGNGKILKIDESIDNGKENEIDKKETDKDKVENKFEGKEEQ